jgi:hypothetical protein
MRSDLVNQRPVASVIQEQAVDSALRFVRFESHFLFVARGFLRQMKISNG